MELMRDRRGQATVELALVLPLAIAVAAVMVNAILFASECASFDRLASQTIRACATSPAHGQSSGSCSSLIASELQRSFNKGNLDVSVSCSGASTSHSAYTATLAFRPTLFGLGLKSSVMGIAMPALRHSATLTVETYKPGVFL